MSPDSHGTEISTHFIFSLLWWLPSLPLDSEGPHQTAEQPECRPGDGPRQWEDLPGQVGGGEAVRQQIPRQGEQAEAQVDQLDGDQEEERGEVPYLENFIKNRSTHSGHPGYFVYAS